MLSEKPTGGQEHEEAISPKEDRGRDTSIHLKKEAISPEIFQYLAIPDLKKFAKEHPTYIVGLESDGNYLITIIIIEEDKDYEKKSGYSSEPYIINIGDGKKADVYGWFRVDPKGNPTGEGNLKYTVLDEDVKEAEEGENKQKRKRTEKENFRTINSKNYPHLDVKVRTTDDGQGEFNRPEDEYVEGSSDNPISHKERFRDITEFGTVDETGLTEEQTRQEANEAHEEAVYNEAMEEEKNSPEGIENERLRKLNYKEGGDIEDYQAARAKDGKYDPNGENPK